MPILFLRYVTIFPSPFSYTISPSFPTNAAESLIACAPLRDFVHLVSNPPRMLGSILCRVECCWQREKLASPRVNGEFHTVY
ncbi:hypothetical protein L218DRAFT_962913 [Marasmius fiardii PR-910]|nr:hypothetical protein L218DRAFT_962913 [Marasmius fiardii PR-910]